MTREASNAKEPHGCASWVLRYGRRVIEDPGLDAMVAELARVGS
jgi:hypothetical protein